VTDESTDDVLAMKAKNKLMDGGNWGMCCGIRRMRVWKRWFAGTP